MLRSIAILDYAAWF